jgi:hypothetical protein
MTPLLKEEEKMRSRRRIFRATLHAGVRSAWSSEKGVTGVTGVIA